MNSRVKVMLLVVIGILLVPLIAMQYTSEVEWSLFDFLIGGLLLFGTGLLIDQVNRRIKGIGKRIAIVFAIVLLLVLVWTELAVGI